MYGTPLQALRIEFLTVLIKRADDADVGLQSRSDLLDVFDDLFVFDVAFEEGVDELQ